MIKCLDFLNGLAQKIEDSFDSDQIFEVVLNKTLEFFSLDAGMAYLREDETWILKRHHNVSEKFVREFFRIDDNHPLFKEATKIRIPIVRQRRMKGNSVHVWLVISLQYKNWINGIMILASKSQISIAESEQKTLMILNKQPGYVI